MPPSRYPGEADQRGPGSAGIRRFEKAGARGGVNNAGVGRVDSEAHYRGGRNACGGGSPGRASIDALLDTVTHAHVHNQRIGAIHSEAARAAVRGRSELRPGSAGICAGVKGGAVHTVEVVLALVGLTCISVGFETLLGRTGVQEPPRPNSCKRER